MGNKIPFQMKPCTVGKRGVVCHNTGQPFSIRKDVAFGLCSKEPLACLTRGVLVHRGL